MLLSAMAPVAAAPPPPPPDYVWDAGKLLTDRGAYDAAKLTALFAPDVTVFENGKRIAVGRAAWMGLLSAERARYNGRVLGFSEGWGGSSNGTGELLIVDTFDTVVRSNLPPTVLADPRMATRSTLYRFGSDRLIHTVRILKADGFWMTQRP